MNEIAQILPGSMYILVGSIVIGLITRFSMGYLLKPLIKFTKTDLDDRIIKILGNPVFITFAFVGTYLYIKSLYPGEEILQNSLNLTLSLVVLVWSYTGIKVAEVVYDEMEMVHGKHSDAVPFLNNITRFVIGITALALLLQVWGVDMAPILAPAGLAGLGVAFAAKDTISNLFGGISIFFDKPYKIGDYVIIDQQYRGEVTDIGMRSTKIRTRDNVLITVPNSVMTTQAVINETGFDPKLRVRLPIGLSYDTDLERAEMVIVQTLKEHKNILDDPPPRVRYRKFADSAVELEAMFLIEPPKEKGLITHEVLKSIFNALKEEKIDIPFPQRDVHINEKKN